MTREVSVAEGLVDAGRGVADAAGLLVDGHLAGSGLVASLGGDRGLTLGYGGHFTCGINGSHCGLVDAPGHGLVGGILG